MAKMNLSCKRHKGLPQTLAHLPRVPLARHKTLHEQLIRSIRSPALLGEKLEKTRRFLRVHTVGNVDGRETLGVSKVVGVDGSIRSKRGR